MTIEELERLRQKQRCFYTKEEIKELLKNISQKVEVEELPATGIENYMYLVPAQTEGHYNQFIWNDNQWQSLGESEEDFTNYVTGPELTSAIYQYCPIIEDDRNGNSAPINGNAPFKTLKDGQIILLHIKYKTYSNATLNLTLSDGTSTGAKDIKMQSTESIVQIKKINTDYGSHVVWSYIPMVYDQSHDCWVCLSSIDTYPFMTSAQIQAGNSTEGKTVTPKLLRDNFYLKSEVDNAKQNKRIFEDNPYVIADVVIDYNDGGITRSSLEAKLDELYDGWNDDPINVAAMNTICADLSAHTISGVKMKKQMAATLNSKFIEIDEEGTGNGWCENYIFILDDSKYINIGTINFIALALPTNVTETDEFLFTFICNSDNCSLTLPTNVKYGSNLNFDNDKQEGRRFQFSIQDNIALYTYVD